MEIQLQELLDRIKKEGLDAADKQAAAILVEAEEKKAALLAEAEKEAAAIRAEAMTAAAREVESGRAALARASRDLLLSFRDKIGAVLEAVVRKDVTAALDADVLRQALPGVLKALASGSSDELAVLLEPATLKKIEGRFEALLGAELKKGVELRPFPDVPSGFRVAEKNGAAYYDFSGPSVAELFSKYLNARMAEIVRDAAKGL
jgi:V/A-type H+-transporting ATPase subunit E